MKLVFFSKGGDVLGIALRCQEEGTECWLYVDDPICKNCGKGYIPLLKSPAEIFKIKPDWVIFDAVGFSRQAAIMNKAGIKTLFSNPLADSLELDRGKGTKIAKQVGIQIAPDAQDFNNLDEVQKYVQEYPDDYVIKPFDNMGSEYTYLAQSPEEMIAYIDWLKQLPRKKESKYQLEKQVKGIEVSTEVWFQNGIPVFPANSTIETKSFLTGNLGPMTGCQSSVVWHYDGENHPLIKEHSKVWPMLKKEGYTGCWDMNAIITPDNGIVFLEWTPRMGFNAIYAFIHTLNTDISQFIDGLGKGKLKSLPVEKAFSYALNVSTPPYPNQDKEKLKKVTGLPFLYDLAYHDYIWYQDLMAGTKYPVIAGGDGCAAIVTVDGEDIETCDNSMNMILDYIHLPNIQYRTDGAKIAKRDYESLKKNKF